MACSLRAVDRPSAARRRPTAAVRVPSPRHRLPDGQRAGVEVDVRPGERERLALPQAGRQGQDPACGVSSLPAAASRRRAFSRVSGSTSCTLGSAVAWRPRAVSGLAHRHVRRRSPIAVVTDTTALPEPCRATTGTGHPADPVLHQRRPRPRSPRRHLLSGGAHNIIAPTVVGLSGWWRRRPVGRRDRSFAAGRAGRRERPLPACCRGRSAATDPDAVAACGQDAGETVDARSGTSGCPRLTTTGTFTRSWRRSKRGRLRRTVESHAVVR